MPRIRVLIVDDAVVIRRMLSTVIEKQPDLEVAGVAANGKIALQKITQCNPDIVTLDVEMPEMDGITALKTLRQTHPKLPVIMVSTLTARGAATTMEALSAGATDYVTKPGNLGRIVEGLDLVERELVPKIRAICARSLTGQSAAAAAPVHAPVRPAARSPRMPRVRPFECLAIGTSTGGPNALHELFARFPAPPPVPVFVVQHMPPLFTGLLAERLTKAGPTPFHEGADGTVALPGHAYLAPGGKHMIVRREGGRVVIRTNEDPPENSCRPAVDPLFRSLAEVYGPDVLSVILTGMGQDGLRGCEHVRERGSVVLAQDEASSVVWGMPGYVANAGLADAVVPLERMTAEIQQRLLAARGLAA